MERSYWILGVTLIWIAQVSFWWTIIPVLICVAFSFGVLSYLYSKTLGSIEIFEQNVFYDASVKPGIRKVLDDVNRNKGPNKIDKRLTGSSVIDDSLHEIVKLILRDYIVPWHAKLSNDENFIFAIEEGLYKVIEKVSSRMKDVDWIEYLTTRLVDDAASHLRLYRQACEKTKIDIEMKRPAPQTLASFKSATQQNYTGGHSRNNSDGAVKTATPKTHSRNSSLGEKPIDLEMSFFQLESECENSRLCHDQVCGNRDSEQRYLGELLDVILYLVLSPDDFQSLPARTLVREVVINGIVLPLLDKLSDADFINQFIIWLCRNVGLTSESFLAALRATVNRDELTAILDIVNKEIAIVRGRDSGGDADALVRQHLSSLLYVKKSIDAKLQGGIYRDRPANANKLVYLPLSTILKNNIALSYFIDYLSGVDMQNYIFLYLSIDSWLTSVKEELQRSDQSRKKLPEAFREDAVAIYQQYFSEKFSKNIRIDTSLEEGLKVRLHEPIINETLFDPVFSALQNELSEKTLTDFYRSPVYLKLLTELELLKDGDAEDDSQSPDTISLAESYEDEESPKPTEPTSGVGKYAIIVEIVDCGVVQDRGKTYGIYALSVVRTYENGYCERWHVYRRYSDFHDLQQKVKDAYNELGKLPFPGKKTFNNMEATTLNKRMKMLNDYLQILLHSGVAEIHPKLPALLMSFLEPGEYDKATSLGSAIESVVSPIKSSMRLVTNVVKTMPDNLLSTVDGFSRNLHQGRKHPTRQVAEILNNRNEDNIPLRIMLLLMDEVFDLHSRNQWLRRRIVTLLRQMFGDIVNRKILNFVEELTAPTSVASYLASLKDSLWPGGMRAEPAPERDEGTRLRTRVVAKTALLSALSDELKHILGSDTTRRGLLRVYNTFQHSRLNRRLLYVLLEGLLELIFPTVSALNLNMATKRDKPAFVK